MKKIILSTCAAVLGFSAMVSLQSCGDELKPYPWIVEGDVNDSEGEGARNMEVCEAELRGAIPLMLGYGKAGGWQPHAYQYNRSNHIDNYAGYWTTTKANFAFGPALPTLYYEPNGYMGGGCDNSIFIQSKNAVLYAATMVDEFDEDVSKPEWRAVALIIQSYQAHEVTDFFGVCPLNDWRNGKQSSLSYEAGPEVYKQIFADLDEAIAILKDRQPSTAEFQKIEGTDAYTTCCDWQWERWVKFANSMKLRMAMNMADYVDPNPVYGPDNKPFTARAIAEEAVKDEIGVLRDGDRDIGWKGPGAQTRQCAVYQIGENWDDIRLNASMENILKHFNSPLLTEWFDSGANPIKDSNGVTAPTGIYGVRAGIMHENIPSKKAGYGPFSVLSVKNSGMDQPFLKRAECDFARAEGALRGWDMGGNAGDLYEQAIRNVFKEWGLSDAEATEYLAQDNLPAVQYVDYYNRKNDIMGRVTIGVKWNEADSKELKLEKIITQRWIGVFPLGAEAWTTFRRTGYPRLFPVKYNMLPDVDTELQIRRMCFTLDENNGPQIAQITELLGGQQHCGVQVFWDVNSRTWTKDANGCYVPDNHLN